MKRFFLIVFFLSNFLIANNHNEKLTNEEVVPEKEVSLDLQNEQTKVLGPILSIEDTTGIATSITCNYLDKYNQKYEQTIVFKEGGKLDIQYYYWMRELIFLQLKNKINNIETVVFEISFDSKNNNFIFNNKLLNSYLDITFFWGNKTETIRVNAQNNFKNSLFSDTQERLKKISIS